MFTGYLLFDSTRNRCRKIHATSDILVLDVNLDDVEDELDRIEDW